MLISVIPQAQAQLRTYCAAPVLYTKASQSLAKAYTQKKKQKAKQTKLWD